MATPSNYVRPQTFIYEEFNQVSSAITGNLQALIAGPQAYLCRHGVAAEQATGALGTYNSAITSTFNWPQRPAGAVVDDEYTKLFVDKAQLQYIAFTASGDASIVPVSGARNQVSCTDASGGFVADGPAFPRYAALHDRNVQVGDIVTIRGVGTDSVIYNVSTYVAGIASTGAQRIPATVQASPTASVTNGVTQTASATVTLVSGTSPNLTLAAGVGAYSALADGVLIETYSVTVVTGSVNGDLTTAQLRVTSASGLDDVASVIPHASGAAVTIGHRGLTLTFTQTTGTPDLVAGQSWHVVVDSAYVAPVVTATGAFVGQSATTYVVTCTRGGLFASGPAPQLSVTTTTGIDSAGPVNMAAAATTIPVGTLGATLTLTSAGTPIGIRKGDSWTIAVTPAMDGAYRTLILGHNLPAALTGVAALDMQLSLNRDVQVAPFDPVTGAVNWAQTAETIAVYPNIAVYDPSWTGNGIPLPLHITTGQLYVEYRAFVIDYVGDVASISDVGTLDAAISGPLTPDNPLKWGVYEALANSNGAAVNFTAVADASSLTAWAAVLSLLVGRSDVYNLVPLTQDRAVQDLFAAHIADQSSPAAGRWRGGFFSLTAADSIVVASAASTSNKQPILAHIAVNPQAAGTAYTLIDVPASNSNFITNGVKPGDIVRTFYALNATGTRVYNEFIVDAVLTEDSLRLVTGPSSPVTIPQLLEVWHVLSKDELAANIGRTAGSFGSRRICAVWPDQIGSAGTLMPGYFLCCSLAGQVSGAAPQRPLTNAALAGYDDVSRSTKFFNTAQLDIMAGSGVWVVTQDPDGTVKTRHGVTTDPTDINTREEMVRRNVDSIALLFQARLAPFIGQMNVTPTAIARLNIEIISVIEYLKQASYTDTLGPQLIDAKPIEVRQHALLKDRIVIILDITIPYALNNIECHLVV